MLHDNVQYRIHVYTKFIGVHLESTWMMTGEGTRDVAPEAQRELRNRRFKISNWVPKRYHGTVQNWIGFRGQSAEQFPT